jgi:8-oxo-dGTP pyrophosphatase MutT (NUDIX family)
MKKEIDHFDAHSLFLRKMLLHALKCGFATACLSIAPELAVVSLVDFAKLRETVTKYWLVLTLAQAVLFLIGMLIGCVRFSLAHLPAISRAVAKDQTRGHLVELIERIGSFEQPSGGHRTHHAPNPCHAALFLLESMGLVAASDHKFIAVSQSADSFLTSLCTHLRGHNTTFMGDWRATTISSESRDLVRMVEGFEAYRIKTDANPARAQRAAIALIRVDFAGIPRFLVIKSPMWNHAGAFTLVMGAEKKTDDGGKLQNTVKREVQEEMNLAPQDILYAEELNTVNDKRVSKRLGLYTDYTYAIFSVQLLMASEAVKSFLAAEPKINIPLQKAIRTHEFDWLTWDELLASPHLIENMPPVVNALRSLDLERLLTTTTVRDSYNTP